jgi:hypothetical protein
MTHKHLQEIHPSTICPEELRERLRWRDENPAEVIRAEREREAQRRLDQKMVNTREGFLLAGGESTVAGRFNHGPARGREARSDPTCYKVLPF